MAVTPSDLPAPEAAATPFDVEAAVEQVRAAIERLACDGPVTQAEYCGPADAALDRLRSHVRALERDRERAVFLAQHLFQMISPDVWRYSGADDGQGHYEGEYRAEQLWNELTALARLDGEPDA